MSTPSGQGALRPFFTYYGGKWRIAPRYPAPLHNSIIEPFAGSAGYSLRYPHRAITLIDASEKIAGTWDYLTKAPSAEIRRLPLVGNDQTVNDLNVCQEARWLIGWWLNHGTEAPRLGPSAWMRSGIRPHSFWGATIRERIARQVAHIRHWRVIHGDYRKIGEGEATWFIDPPYAGKPGRRYTLDKIDYGALAEWCKSRTGQVIVCEHEGATWLPFTPLVLAKANSGRQKASTRSPEAIWLNS